MAEEYLDSSPPTMYKEISREEAELLFHLGAEVYGWSCWRNAEERRMSAPGWSPWLITDTLYFTRGDLRIKYFLEEDQSDPANI